MKSTSLMVFVPLAVLLLMEVPVAAAVLLLVVVPMAAAALPCKLLLKSCIHVLGHLQLERLGEPLHQHPYHVHPLPQLLQRVED